MTAPLNSLPKASSELEPDEFELFDLTVTVEGGNFVCRHFACVHTDMVPVHAVWKIIFKQLKPCLHALLRKIAA